jgi:hypothetical protein
MEQQAMMIMDIELEPHVEMTSDRFLTPIQ